LFAVILQLQLRFVLIEEAFQTSISFSTIPGELSPTSPYPELFIPLYFDLQEC